MKTMFVLMSHDLTPAQKEDARMRWGVEEFVTVPAARWSQIQADAESVCPHVEDAKRFLDGKAGEGDILLVQGDFGATVNMVAYARSRGLVPVYATTKRETRERVEGDSVVTVRVFTHVRFRVYEEACG